MGYEHAPKFCPRCRELYTEPPAISRYGFSNCICPECGTREALDRIGVPIDKQDAIIALINKIKEEHTS